MPRKPPTVRELYGRKRVKQAPTTPKPYRSRGTGAQWKALRLRILHRDHFTCCDCGRPGDEVDHIVALADGGAWADESNLVTRCKSCHGKKSAQDRAARRRK